ncbi:MAG: hypothetical protein GF421_11015 [Candidatus Aminicenantes bacterium]|nr:hypothetical protein [Candidatus Aminicenantes bacterium]
MGELIASITLPEALALLLFLSSFWLIKILIKGERENFIRGVILFLFLLLGLLYLNQSEAKKITLSDVKSAVFPQKETLYVYTIEKGQLPSRGEYTRYIFKDPKPRLDLKMDSSHRYFHMENPSSLNKVLKELDLPELNSGTRELASLTGSQNDLSIYRWDDYPPGILIMEKTTCVDKSSVTRYHCLSVLTLIARY